MAGTGVYPVHNNTFKIGTAGRASTTAQMLPIKDMESFSISIDGVTQEWNPMDMAGWMRRAVTGKSLTYSLSGKRNYGDDGNDYVAGLLLATGQGVETKFEHVFADGSKLAMNVVIDLKAVAGGEATDIDGLEFDVLSDGLPVFTPAT